MAAGTAEKCDWLVVVPDLEGVLEKRWAVRADHFKNGKPMIEAGFWKMGGAMLSEPPAKGSASYITGSAMVAHAATKEEVLELMKSDVYAQGVWDFDKIQIYPFATAFRKE